MDNKEIDPSLTELNRVRTEIDSIRQRIDIIDGVMASLLNARFGLTGIVGDIKAKVGMRVLNESRETQVLENISRHTSEDGISEEDLKDIFKLIMQKSRKAQDQIAEPKQPLI